MVRIRVNSKFGLFQIRQATLWNSSFFLSVKKWIEYIALILDRWRASVQSPQKFIRLRAKCGISYPVSWTAARKSLKSTDGNCFTLASSSASFFFVCLFCLARLQEHNLFKSRKGNPAIICHHPLKLSLFFSNIALRNVPWDHCPAKRQIWRQEEA